MAPGLGIGSSAGETSVECVAPLAGHSLDSPLMCPHDVQLVATASLAHGQIRRSIDVAKADESAVQQDASHGPVDPRITKNCWQYQATRNVAAAAVLHDLKAEHLPSGGPRGVERKACQEIARRNFEDTFYIVDLGNTTRLYKADLSASQSHVTPASPSLHSEGEHTHPTLATRQLLLLARALHSHAHERKPRHVTVGATLRGRAPVLLEQKKEGRGLPHSHQPPHLCCSH
eukprot:CAMPEP_0202356146 /NCGR_PEP_ID=MMETSP1126-20121109/10740_1 /ASSEMBLY_ACC=CAM_ASM_000457 /TAXON_ID=3047 /ORGANISM="Dunaliella tertiolecta, Strain CCMP1320" /LENGTH=230 /DNA_ID=CAMNT_0048948869 /DNA_START=149 /DNA_END=841 /DNA_ORIENTATION=+